MCPPAGISPCHRIALDRDCARQVEGHPDLVVNGGLVSLLATEFLRTDLRLALVWLSARYLALLHVNRPMASLAVVAGGTGRILILDSNGIVAAEMTVTFA